MFHIYLDKIWYPLCNSIVPVANIHGIFKYTTEYIGKHYTKLTGNTRLSWCGTMMLAKNIDCCLMISMFESFKENVDKKKMLINVSLSLLFIMSALGLTAFIMIMMKKDCECGEHSNSPRLQVSSCFQDLATDGTCSMIGPDRGCYNSKCKQAVIDKCCGGDPNNKGCIDNACF